MQRFCIYYGYQRAHGPNDNVISAMLCVDNQTEPISSPAPSGGNQTQYFHAAKIFIQIIIFNEGEEKYTKKNKMKKIIKHSKIMSFGFICLGGFCQFFAGRKKNVLN